MTTLEAIQIAINCAVQSLTENDKTEWEAIRVLEDQFNLRDELLHVDLIGKHFP